MTTMFGIDMAAQNYSKAHDKLTAVVRALEAETAKLRLQYLPQIRKAVETAASRKADLRDALNESRELFVKPKTRVMHGVKVGFQKGKGKLDWDDDELVVKLIRKHLPEIAETLIRIEESPIVAALNDLDVKDLRKIGVRAEETGDKVVIKPTDSEIDKLVDALLRDEEPEAA